jgi:branched-subunit amino acid ABC-type transport system permease component
MIGARLHRLDALCISVAVITAAFAGALIVQRRAISTVRHSTWSCD